MAGTLESFRDWFEKLFPELRKQVYDAAKLADNEYSTWPMGGHHGPGDAYHHILWAAEVARNVGPESARLITQYYEVFVDTLVNRDQTWKDYWMDTYNNALGIEIGMTARSWDEVVSLARGKIVEEINGEVVGRLNEKGGARCLLRKRGQVCS